MRLVSVTVSIHQLDILKLTTSNRKQFDQWVVVTTSDDSETILWCESEKVTCVVVDADEPSVGPFDPAFNKATYINKGLEACSHWDWAVILDSDILLPRSFRDVVATLSLDPRCLYGMIGRCQCESPAAYKSVMPFEPWRYCIEVTPSPLGYFHMFSRKCCLSGYPRSDPNGEMHDDGRFVALFKRSLWRQLPLTCLHIGRSCVSWQRRSLSLPMLARVEERAPSNSSRFIHDSLTPLTQQPKDCSHINEIAADCLLVSMLPSHVQSRATGLSVLLIGDPSIQCLSELSRIGRIACWVRESRLSSATKHLEKDVRFVVHENIREFSEDNSSYDENLVINTVSACERLNELLGDGELDIILLAREFDDEDWMDWLPVFEKKLANTGVVCGGFYGWADFPHATASLVRFVGTPDVCGMMGTWLKRGLSSVRQHSVIPAASTCEHSGFVYCLGLSPNWEALCLSLTALRTWWTGPVAALTVDSRCPEFWRLRRNFGLRELELLPFPYTPQTLVTLSPYESTLFLTEGIIPSPRCSQIFRTLTSASLVIPKDRGRAGAVSNSPAKDEQPQQETPFPWFGIRKSADVDTVLSKAESLCQPIGFNCFISQLQYVAQHVSCERWTTEAFINVAAKRRAQPATAKTLSQLEELTIANLTPLVALGQSFTVATCITRAMLPFFLRNRLTWRFASDIVIVASESVCAMLARVRQPPGYPRFILRASKLAESSFSSIQSILTDFVPVAGTSHVVCLEPGLAAAPGSQLFAQKEWESYDLIASGYFFALEPNLEWSARQLCRLRFPHTALSVRLAKELGSRFPNPAPASIFEKEAARYVADQAASVSVIDLRKWGWQYPSKAP